MKLKIYVYVFMFCFAFSSYKSVMANELEDYVYNANITIEYQEGTYYNKVIYQEYEIYNVYDEKLAEGKTNSNGIIQFSYLQSYINISDECEIRIVILPKNDYSQVIDSRSDIFWLCY